jgi:ribosomal protein S4E
LIDQDIYVNDNNMYNLDTNEIIERIIMDANSLNIVSDGSETKSIRNIIHIYKQDGNFDLVTLNDARGHNLITRINYVFVIVKMGKSAIILSKGN